MPDGSSCLPTAGSLVGQRRGLLEAGEDFPLVGAQRGAVADQRRNRGAGSADARLVPAPLTGGAWLALPVAAGRARRQGAVGWAAAAWSMALISASVVVVNGSVLRAARLRTSAPSSADMVRSAKTLARPGARPSGSKRVTSAARHRANTLSKAALNSSSPGASSRTMVAIAQPLW